MKKLKKKTIFKRICKRCDNSYITNARFSDFCEKCKLPNRGEKNKR